MPAVSQDLEKEKPRLRGVAQDIHVSHIADYGPGLIWYQRTGARIVRRAREPIGPEYIRPDPIASARSSDAWRSEVPYCPLG